MSCPSGRSTHKSSFRSAQAFVSLLLFMVPSVLGAQQIPKAERHYEIGLTLQREQKYREAAQEFKKAVEINPELADAYYHLGLSYFKEGNSAEAIRYLLRLNQLEPDNLDAAITAGKIYSSLGYFNDAVALYLRAIQKRGELPYAIDGEKDARRELDPYTQRKPSASDANYYLGVLELDAAQYRPAVTQLNSAISLNPQLGKAFCYLGEAYDRLGELSQAEHAVRRCLSRYPNYRPALQVMHEIKKEQR